LVASLVNYGANQTFNITPNAGFHVANVLVDGASVGAVTAYTFSNVTAGHTISATFAVNTYTITSSGGPNGIISPIGATTVNHGSSRSYTITPNIGYQVQDVLVDGASVGPLTFYNFTNITASHTISVTFAANTYTITASAGPNGSVSPGGVTNVTYNASQGYTITAAPGFHVLDVLVDGASVGAVTSYTFSNVAANHTISATFDNDTYNVFASANTGGSIAPSGAIVVTSGSNQGFTITANANYHLVDVLVDSVSVGPVATYTFSNITANHSISAVFAIDTYAITASAGANGSIAPAGVVNVAHGASQGFAITPDLGFEVQNVLVDGASAGPVASYTFSNVVAPHTIAASFQAIVGEGEGEGEGEPLAIFSGPPALVVLQLGDTYLYAVSVTGGTGVIHFQWYFRNQQNVEIPVGTDSPLLSVGPVDHTDQGAYYCEVSDDIDVISTQESELSLVQDLPLGKFAAAALFAALLAGALWRGRRAARA
jgi:hypothetical protein